jgi:hypothetical protein
MIYVNSGFPKSGTTLFQVYVEEMLDLCFLKNGQAEMHRRFPNAYVHRIGIINALKLLYINVKFGSLVVKTHQDPGLILRILLFTGLAKAIYTLRDPRDVVLSALDHAETARKKINPTQADKSFVQFNSLEDLLPYIKKHHSHFLRWKKLSPINCIRYETLIGNTDIAVKQLSAAFGFEINGEQNIYERVIKNPSSQRHFNEGKLKRYMIVSEDQRTNLTNALRDIIIEMDYTL